MYELFLLGLIVVQKKITHHHGWCVWQRYLMRWPRGLRFIVVGGCAAMVHYMVVLLCVEYFQIAVLLANVGAFLLAFCVSFSGHTYLTFHPTELSNTSGEILPRQRFKKALPRFFIVAVSAFVCNEMLLYFLINHLAWPYQLALAVALITVASVTYIVSKYWAFHVRDSFH